MNEALEILARVGTDNAPTLDELTSARDTIARELHRLKGEGNTDLAALVTLRDAYTAAAAAVTEAEEIATQAASEIDEVLADIPNPDESAPTGEVTEEEGAEENEPQAVAASGRVLSIRDAVARLGLTPTAQTQVTEPEVNDLSATRHTVMLGTDQKDDATWRDVAQAFVSSGRSLKTGKDRVVRISTEFADDRTISNTGDLAGNTRLVDSFVSLDAVSAAGGCCSLATPIRTNPVLGSTARPIRDSLPTIGVNGTGDVSFFPAICLPDSGADIWTCDEDALVDPEDPLTWKQCLEVECEEEQRVGVEGIYACLEIGNFQSRFAPEQWQGHLQAVAVRQARIAEVELFTKMRAATTSTHTGEATGSVFVNVVQTLSLAAALIRQDQRLTDVRLEWVVADWIRNAIFNDLTARKVRGADSLDVSDQMLSTALGNLGIDATFSPDVDDIEAFQYDGALAGFPATASTVLAPSGFFTFLDGGTLDLGTEIRDHDLNRQNKVAAFAESFEGLLARGCNAKSLDIPVEICDSVPCEAPA